MVTSVNDGSDEGFDLLRNDLLLRWQRKLRIAPQEGLGVVRRAIFFALLTWLPLVIWAALNQRLLDSGTGEPLLNHFGIHVRCLVAIPLFILAEAMARGVLHKIIVQFRKSGIVDEKQLPAFRAVLTHIARLRDSSSPWIALIGITLVVAIGTPVHVDSHDMAWAAAGTDFGFAGWWFLYVARPIFLILLLGWFWRIILVILLFHRLSKLELSLVPSHPDRCGGLGFVKKLPVALFLVTIAVSAIIASTWIHNEIYHDQLLSSYKTTFAVFVVLWSAIVLSPLLLLAPRIAAMKKQALLTYGALLAKHGRLVHQRWILGQTVSGESDSGNDLLDAPELGPVVDISAVYDAVQKITPVPIGKDTIIMVILPIMIPMVFVIVQQIPLSDIIKKLLSAVV